ncbi:MAG: hypothetical protein V4723_02040 [Pseudomonadota bacterium]
MTDDQFLTELGDCSLHPADFDHLGHMRLAWICLQRYPREQAIELACKIIHTYATHHGAPEKFHRTVSEALMRLLGDKGAANRAQSFAEFLAANDGFVDNARSRLSDHYSAALLDSAEARAAFLPPDRAPLP